MNPKDFEKIWPKFSLGPANDSWHLPEPMEELRDKMRKGDLEIMKRSLFISSLGRTIVDIAALLWMTRKMEEKGWAWEEISHSGARFEIYADSSLYTDEAFVDENGAEIAHRYLDIVEKQNVGDPRWEIQAYALVILS